MTGDLTMIGFTGVPGPGQQFGQTMHQTANSTFGQIANMQPPQPPQMQPQQTGAGGGDKFAPGNIFAAMKRADFTKPEEQRPQDSGEY